MDDVRKIAEPVHGEIRVKCERRDDGFHYTATLFYDFARTTIAKHLKDQEHG